MTIKKDDPIQEEIEKRMKKRIIKENAIEFSRNVEHLVNEQDLTYMEAIAEIMQDKGYEVEKVVKLITPDLKAHIETEAEGLSLLKTTLNRIE